jgi:hypothetical protein
VITWQITGGITATMLNKALGLSLSGSVGGTVTRSFASSGTAHIDGFCKECHAESGHEYTITTYQISCTKCTWWAVGGNYKTYKGQYAKAFSNGQPVPPCQPNCPPSE